MSKKVTVCVELNEDTYQAYADEARRRRVKIETVVGQALSLMVKDFEREREEGPEYIIPS